MLCFPNKKNLVRHSFKGILYINNVFNTIFGIFGILEIRPKLCQCDDLHKFENICKMCNLIQKSFKKYNYFQLFFYWPTQSVNAQVLNIHYHLITWWCKSIQYVNKKSSRKRGWHADSRLHKKEKDRETKVLSRGSPKSGYTAVLF